jgi:hypothetical protein
LSFSALSIPALSSSLPRRTGRPVTLFGALLLLVTTAVALAGPSAAATSNAPATPSAVSATAAAPVAPLASAPVGSLTLTGTTTTVTVHRVYRRGQVQWINHVLSTRLVDLDGCQAQRSRASWDGRTYRATVRTVCADGPSRSQAAARSLVADRPWYQVNVTRVPLVGFGLLADLPSGSDRAVPAALAKLPSGPFTFAEGDDLSLNYVGQGVTQAQLDDAVAAFARALGISTNQVEVAPLAS